MGELGFVKGLVLSHSDFWVPLLRCKASLLAWTELLGTFCLSRSALLESPDLRSALSSSSKCDECCVSPLKGVMLRTVRLYVFHIVHVVYIPRGLANPCMAYTRRSAIASAPPAPCQCLKEEKLCQIASLFHLWHPVYTSYESVDHMKGCVLPRISSHNVCHEPAENPTLVTP